MAGTYRGHGHALARGTDPDSLVAEMLGRATGVCGGRAGSMNVIDLPHGLVGSFGIVGGSIAAATGAALSARAVTAASPSPSSATARPTRRYFHECLNFAAALALPAVFVCENNFYGEFTPMEQVTAGRDIAGRAAAYGMPAARVDGNDVWAVHEVAEAAVRRARGGGGPTLLEARPTATTATRSPTRARTAPRRRSSAGWRATRWTSRAPGCSSGAPRREDVDGAEREARARIDRAVEAALAAPYPDPAHERATEFKS